MKIFFAGLITGITQDQHYLYDYGLKELSSFFYCQKKGIEMDAIKLFLDSGAYSAWSKGVDIDIDKYITFIKKYEKYIDVYAVLDDITSPEKTWQNQQYMEAADLKPLPVFHYNEPIEYLHKCMEYEYFALGGMVPISTAELTGWLDQIWFDLVDDDGYPKFKVHGFGLTSLELINRYPWHSVDSTSWVMTGRFGGVFCPLGSINKINISDKGDLQNSAHFYQLPKHDQLNIENYFSKLGFTIEELKEDYKKRDEVNIIYFLNLEKQLTEHPPRFLRASQVSLF